MLEPRTESPRPYLHQFVVRLSMLALLLLLTSPDILSVLRDKRVFYADSRVSVPHLFAFPSLRWLVHSNSRVQQVCIQSE